MGLGVGKEGLDECGPDSWRSVDIPVPVCDQGNLFCSRGFRVQMRKRGPHWQRPFAEGRKHLNPFCTLLHTFFCLFFLFCFFIS